MPRRGNSLGGIAENLLQVGLLLRPAHGQRLNDRVQMVALRAHADRGSHTFVEGHAADGVLLPQQQIGQAHRDRAGVFVLVQRPAAVLHAVRDVDQQRAAEVGVFLELLDVVAVLLGPDLPVDVAQVVAGRVFAVLQELDRLPEVRDCGACRRETLRRCAGHADRAARSA